MAHKDATRSCADDATSGHSPLLEVRQILSSTKTLIVMGFSSTGRGHERLTAVVDEIVAREDAVAARATTIVTHMPEPWKGKLTPQGAIPTDPGSRMDHTASIVRKLRACTSLGCRLLFCRAAKTITGFCSPDGSTPARLVMDELAVARPSDPGGEDIRRLLRERDFVCIRANMHSSAASYEWLADSVMPRARGLLTLLANEAPLASRVVVVTDMDPSLTSAALKLKASFRAPQARVECIDFENHQEQLLRAFDICSKADVEAKRGSFGEVANSLNWDGDGDEHALNEAARIDRVAGLSDAIVQTGHQLVRSAFLFKVLSVGKEGLRVAHVDIVDPSLRRSSRADLEVYRFAADRNEAIRFLVRHGHYIGGAEAVGSTEGVIYRRDRDTGDSVHHIRHIIYVCVHTGASSLLDHFRSRIEQHPDLLVVGCGMDWHLGREEELGGRSNAMRICQLAQGHGIINAGAGASGEASDMIYTFGSPSVVVIPLSGHLEQEGNSREMKRCFGEAVLLARWQAGFDMRSLDGFFDPWLSRARSTVYLGADAARAAIDGLLAKDSPAQHAAKLLAGEAGPTEKERVAQAFSDMTFSSGVFRSLKQTRRRLKGFFQIAQQLREMCERSTPEEEDFRFLVAQRPRHKGERETRLCLGEVAARVGELESVFFLLGVDAQLFAEAQQAMERMASLWKARALRQEHVAAAQAAMDALAASSSSLFLTGF